MAGDWIKMRVWLSRDPKVIRMAKWLVGQPQFMNPMGLGGIELAANKRNVTVALCVTGLLVTWGTAREQGDRDGDDLVLRKCDLSTLDAMTDMPHFGAAMAHVDWAVEREDDSLCFPNFFKDNESPDDKHRRQNASRQAKFRDAHKETDDVQSNGKVTALRNVTVTHREEKRREVKATPFAPNEKISFDAERGWIGITDDDRLQWQAAFPAIDVKIELAKARVWALSNPKNRKSNWRRFLASWFTRAQDKAPRVVDKRTTTALVVAM